MMSRENKAPWVIIALFVAGFLLFGIMCSRDEAKVQDPVGTSQR